MLSFSMYSSPRFSTPHHENFPLMEAMLQFIFWNTVHELRRFSLHCFYKLKLGSFECRFHFEEHGARSVKYVGCSITGTLCFARNIFTERAMCAGAVSWWKIHDPFFTLSVTSSHLFTKGLENLFIVDLVYCLTFRHPIGSLQCWRKQSSWPWI